MSESRYLPEGPGPEAAAARAVYINDEIKRVAPDTNLISDGFHTFGELYKHRIVLYIALCKQIYRRDQDRLPNGQSIVWRSRRHSDGQLAYGGGWFVLGLAKDAGHQITYHLPESYWAQCEFAFELDQAPEWDQHSSDDVLERLLLFFC